MSHSRHDVPRLFGRPRVFDPRSTCRSPGRFHAGSINVGLLHIPTCEVLLWIARSVYSFGVVFRFRQLGPFHESTANPCPDFPSIQHKCHGPRSKRPRGHGANFFAFAATPDCESSLFSAILFNVKQLPCSAPDLTFNSQLQCDLFYQWCCTRHHPRTTVWFSTHPCH